MSELPESTRQLLDGGDLANRIGFTVLVAAVGGDDWPRIATLSVGEVFAPSATQLLFTLYERSRTASAIGASRRALLTIADSGALVKVRVDATLVEDAASRDAGRVVFRGTIVGIERDAVPYARVTHGVEFELLSASAAVARWADQIEGLKRIAQS